MMDGKRQQAYAYLVDLAEKQGYVTFDEIIDSAEKWNLPIQDVDWLSGAVTTRGILVYDEVPISTSRPDNEEYDDFAHGDYEAVFARVIELDESLAPFIEDVRELIPPQARELSSLKYQVREGNDYAKTRMIEMHLRLAVKVALQRAEAMDFDISDAIGYACIGLLQAIEKYDPDVNGAFSGYASLWMYQVIGRMQPTKRPQVYYPVHKKENYFAMYPYLKEKGCFECNEIVQCKNVRNMICQKLECGEEQAEDVVLASIPFLSYENVDMFLENIDVCEKHDECESILQDKKTEEDAIIIEDVFLNFDMENNVERVFLKNNLMDILSKTLREKERQVLLMRYGFIHGEEKTLDEVGKAFGVTRERIRQIEAKALKKLQQPKILEKLRDYL